MADTRAVRNPFTKKENHLRRNTRGTKWISADSEHITTYRPSLSKTVAHQAHSLSDPSQSAHTYENDYRGRQWHEQSPPPMLTAAIYDPEDLRDLPNIHPPLPTVRSWGSLRPSVHDDCEGASPRTYMPPPRPHVDSPISPLNNEPTDWRDSAVSGIDVNHFTPKDRERQESNVTVFPSFLYTIKQHEEKSMEIKSIQASQNSDDIYHTAKAIYAAGPKGEGQKLWTSYIMARKARQDRTGIKEITRQPLREIEALHSRRPPDAPGLSAHPPNRPNRPPPSQIRIEPRKAVRVNEHLHPRKSSNISDTSCEVPLRIDPDVEHSSYRSNPLRSYPSLQAAPKSRKQAHSPQPYTSAQDRSSKPLPPAPHPPIPPSSSPCHLTPPPPPKPKVTKTSPWWKSLAEKPSESYIPTSKVNTDIKISRPRPITALQNGRTANVAAENGGVGGPGAYGIGMSEKAKGKQKVQSPTVGVFGKGWLDREKRKRDSDASFACVGVEGSAAFGERVARFGEKREMRPEPLFSGTRGEKGRDKRFYGPVQEVLDEYWY